MRSESFDMQYKRILRRILEEGVDTDDRTGVGVRKVFDEDIKVDLSNDEEGVYLLPALTLRRVFPRVAFEELFWMLSGSTDANVLKEKKIGIWDGNTSREFLDERGLTHLNEGHGGRIYGYQFRKFNGHVDQLKSVVASISENPHSRRHFISLWNPDDLDECALPPCHLSYQFVVIGDKLNLKFYMRSNDFILGNPMNMMFSAFFLTFMANVTGYNVGRLTCSIGDCHIYNSHIGVAEELLDRLPVEYPATFKWNCPIGVSPAFIDGAISSMKWGEVSVDYSARPRIERERLVMAT